MGSLKYFIRTRSPEMTFLSFFSFFVFFVLFVLFVFFVFLCLFCLLCVFVFLVKKKLYKPDYNILEVGGPGDFVK